MKDLGEHLPSPPTPLQGALDRIADRIAKGGEGVKVFEGVDGFPAARAGAQTHPPPSKTSVLYLILPLLAALRGLDIVTCVVNKSSCRDPCHAIGAPHAADFGE